MESERKTNDALQVKLDRSPSRCFTNYLISLACFGLAALSLLVFKFYEIGYVLIVSGLLSCVYGFWQFWTKPEERYILNYKDFDDRGMMEV